MSRTIRTAVAAAVSQASRMQIIRGLADANVALDCMCADGLSALRALSDFQPDLLVTDLFLPCMDGQALAKRALCRFELPVRPAVLILFDGRSCPPEMEALRCCGVEFLKSPYPLDSFIAAVNYLRHSNIHFTNLEEQRIDSLLEALGVPKHPGRSYLKLAALLCAADQRFRQNLGAWLYPKVGEAFGINARQIERAIRHVISLAWQSDKFDNQYRIFADTVDAGRGQPTCSEMISRLADILRLEG